jgi:hypothetical protein
VDLGRATVHIEQSRTVTMHGKSLVKAPKTQAGRRTIAVPESLMPKIRNHLERFAGEGPDDLVFMGITGFPLTANVLPVAWQRARAKVGRNDLRLHDYADLRVMPTSIHNTSSVMANDLKWSA